MIDIKLRGNRDEETCHRCDYCGEIHTEVVDMTTTHHPEAGFVLSRRCAKKMIADLQKFLKLNASGLYRERQRKPSKPLQQGEV
jgi:hypothetical protein